MEYGVTTAADLERKMEIKKDKTRIRGEEFVKWQRETEKIERDRAKSAEIEMEREMAKEKEREKAQIQNEAD